MKNTINIYCDESCHLENDSITVMSLGGVWCPNEQSKIISERIREIKELHGLSRSFEIKWTKVSPSKVNFYLNLVDYFFDNSDLHFRGVVIPNKNKLAHEKFGQTHDEWYYKMYFVMLKNILSPESSYRVFIDIKDTRGGEKVKKLHEVLCNSILDFSQDTIERVQQIRSHESEILQLADLILGALCYANRGIDTSTAKKSIIDRIKLRSKYSLVKTTLPQEEKFNILVWSPQELELC